VKGFLLFLFLFRKTAAVLGVAGLFLALLVRFFLPEITASVIGLLGLSLLLFLTAILGARSEIRPFIRSKRFRYGLNTLVMIALFVIILILANYLGILKHRRYDLTAAGRFTLAPQTVKVIKGFREPVKALCFFPDDIQFEGPKKIARDLLEEYKFFNKNFSFRFIDPESQPALAHQYKVRQYGTIVFISGAKQKAVLTPSEQNFTGALLEVSGAQAKKIYFLTGNEERDISDNDQNGYSAARMGLIRDLYQVQTVNLTLKNEIPPDCSVLIMAGTKKVPPPEVLKTIKTFLEKHGKLLMLIDPNPPQEVKEILSAWGLKVNEGRVMDPGAYVAPDMAVPAVFRNQYPPLVITSGLDTTYFPDAVSFDLTNELGRILETMIKEGGAQAGWPLKPVQYQSLAILPLILTTPESWMEKEGKKSSDPEKTRSLQALGAMIIAGRPVGAEVPPGQPEKREKLTRLIVIGDSDFSSNAHFKNGGNGDLFLNSVNWLAEEEHLISIRPKPYTFRKLLVNNNQLRFIRYSSVGLLPLLTLLLGGIIWWRKR
jgi:ABC-type uncharacterized transport system involved in gliding motility auxiliary subunit